MNLNMVGQQVFNIIYLRFTHIQQLCNIYHIAYKINLKKCNNGHLTYYFLVPNVASCNWPSKYNFYSNITNLLWKVFKFGIKVGQYLNNNIIIEIFLCKVWIENWITLPKCPNILGAVHLLQRTGRGAVRVIR